MSDQLSKKDPDGTTLGTSTTDKIGFHAATPTVQRAGAAQASAVFTKKVTGVGFTTSAKFTAFVALVIEIRAALVEKGLIKGAA